MCQFIRIGLLNNVKAGLQEDNYLEIIELFAI